MLVYQSVYNTFHFQFHHDSLLPATPLGVEDILSHWKGPHRWPLRKKNGAEDGDLCFKIWKPWMKLHRPTEFVQIPSKMTDIRSVCWWFWDIQYGKQEAGQSQKAGAFQGIVLTFQKSCVFLTGGQWIGWHLGVFRLLPRSFTTAQIRAMGRGRLVITSAAWKKGVNKRV